VNRRFQAKVAKSKNMHIIKTTASISTKFCTVIKRPPNNLCVWSELAHNKSKMADGRHLRIMEKLPYLGSGLTDFDEVWHYDAIWLYPLWHSLNTSTLAVFAEAGDMTFYVTYIPYKRAHIQIMGPIFETS